MGKDFDNYVKKLREGYLLRERNKAKYLQAIQKHEQTLHVIEALAEETTLSIQTRRFYDVLSERVPGTFTDRFLLDDKQKEKIGITPTDLINLLDSFVEEPFDRPKLDYLSVREDISRWQSIEKETVGRLGGGLVLSVFGGVATGISAVYGYLPVAIPAGITMVGGLVLLKRGISYPKPKETDFQLNEFTKLHAAAEMADHFIDEHYRKDFIYRALNSQRASS